MPLRPLSDLKLHGGDPALDLVNSLDDRGTPREQDFISDYESFIRWCGHSGLLDAAEVRRLCRWGKANEAEAGEIAAGALRLRDALRGLLDRGRRGVAPDPEQVRVVNDLLPSRSELAFVGKRFRLRQEAVPGEAPLHMLALRAVQLLTSDLQDRIRLCEGAGCDWYFLDRSRSRPRRWCSMKGCGNRAKGQRHSARTRRLSRSETLAGGA